MNHSDVSIRARAWRAIDTGEVLYGSIVFQSAPAHGGRSLRKLCEVNGEEWFQSAPAHGGRWCNSYRVRWRTTSFNPRPRMAGDIRVALYFNQPGEFQSAPAHGGRSKEKVSMKSVVIVSIRARAWRAIRARKRHYESFRCFNPRPRMAGDPVSISDCLAKR